MVSHLVAIAAGALSLPVLALGVPSVSDPCVKVAGKLYVPPADALACQKYVLESVSISKL
jgi:hypothetical protein